MKSPLPYPFLILFIFLFNSCNEGCPDCPKSTTELNEVEDLAAYLNGESRILFTKASVKDDVLELLNAEPLENGIYQLPIKDVVEEDIMMCFSIAEVEDPYIFVGFEQRNACFEDILLSLEADIDELIEGDLEDLVDDILLATGDALGQLTFEIGDDNDRRIEQGKLEDAQKTKENLKEVKKETKKDAKEAAEKIKEKLEQNDKDGAKEKAKEYYLDLKGKWADKLKWDYGSGWCDQFDYYNKWGKACKLEVELPDLLKTFVKNNITYKVYENAKCNPIANPTLIWPCGQDHGIDSVPPAVKTYFKIDAVPSKSCIKGNSFCVEQEVIVQIEKIYSDPQCTMLIDLKTRKGFSCK